jgi:hypothetical protein
MPTKSNVPLPSMPTPEHISQHISYFQEDIDLLKELKEQIPHSKKWQINWDEIDLIASTENWENLPIYKTLKKAKDQPPIYFFSSPELFSYEVYKSFSTGKNKSTRHRNKSGIGHEEFINICHIPKYYKETYCLYVGSKRNGLHERFKSHLGYGHKNTGSIFLRQSLIGIQNPPKIYFNYCILEKKYRRVIEHLERMLQDRNDPLIGQRVYKSIPTLCLFSYEYSNGQI